MIDRRKLMFASLAGIVAPVCAVFAQPAPDHRDDHAMDNHAMDNHATDDHARPEEHAAAVVRPRMPAPRHEVRPRMPGAGYRWRDGHWNWSGREWVWAGGAWYR
jgi:hypothetical protein